LKRLTLLAAAAIAYVLAAWTVAPGFYDGFGPTEPYRWTCPPAQAGANTKPSSGHADIKVTNGKSEAWSVYTQDGQIVIGFLPDSFDAGGKTTISVDITPPDTCPEPKGVRFVTNIYRIIADAPLKKKANVTLLYSNLKPHPDDIYRADDPNRAWTPLERSPQGQPYTIYTSTDKVGYFAAGYVSSTTPPPGGVVTIGGGQTLPIIVAVLIVVVVLAGLPLALMRRRRSAEGTEEDDEEGS
jgi:hypothetical protein